MEWDSQHEPPEVFILREARKLTSVASFILFDKREYAKRRDFKKKEQSIQPLVA